MAHERRGVMAAPNLCAIEARVLDIQPSEKYPDKWYFELEVLHSKAVEGPNFARVGETVKAFSVGSIPDRSKGAVITARAKYIGDERGGTFQLFEIAVTGR